MEEEQFCLRWNDFETNFQSSFQELRKNKALIDVTLACEDKEFQAHRVILSSSSSFFRSILQANQHQHPWFYLKGIKHEELSALLDFIYNGEVNISQAALNNFLKVAEDLSIKGLTKTRSNPISSKVKRSRSNSIEQANKRRPIQIPKQIEPTLVTEIEQHSEFIRVKTEFDTPEEVSEVNTGKVCVFEDPSDMLVNPLETSHDSEEHGDVDQTVDQTYQRYENDSISEDPTEDVDLSSVIESMITRHQVEQKDGKFMTYLRCSVCFRYYHVKHSTNLRNHIEAKHLIGDKYKCDHCEKQFKTNSAIRKHMSVTHAHILQQPTGYNYTK
eukprot:GFUD01029888.1.p1 GENE.GFUD01029888.1~~GFUD01029888.1.p1  ORF type:complete len:329 (+),score=79.97 GFUD01029888.1:21-1007(+)